MSHDELMGRLETTISWQEYLWWRRWLGQNSLILSLLRNQDDLPGMG